MRGMSGRGATPIPRTWDAGHIERTSAPVVLASRVPLDAHIDPTLYAVVPEKWLRSVKNLPPAK